MYSRIIRQRDTDLSRRVQFICRCKWQAPARGGGLSDVPAKFYELCYA